MRRPDPLLVRLLTAERSQIAIAVLSGVVWMVSLATVPLTVGWAIDAAVEPGAEGAGRVFPALGVTALAAVVGATSGAIRHFAAVRLWVRTRIAVEGELTDRLLDRRGGIERPIGELLSLSIGDATKIGLVADVTGRGAGALLAIVAVGVWLLTISPTLALVVLAAVGLTLGLFAPFMEGYAGRSSEERRQLAEASASASDGVVGLRVAHGIGGDDRLRSWFRERSRTMHDAALSVVRFEALLFGTVGSLPMLSVVPVVWFGALATSDGTIGAGDFVAAVGLAQFLGVPIFTVGEVIRTVTAGGASARRIEAVLDADVAVEERTPTSGATPPASSRPTLVLDDVHASVDGRRALCGLSCEVVAGETVGIACGSDAEARALTDVLARHRPPSRGTIVVDGHELAGIELDELHTALVVIDTERPWLLSAPLRDNLRLAAPAADDATLRSALVVAAADELLAVPDPLDRELGDRGLRLSGGQRQRIAVAQAVLCPARVVVVVEPTSALDAATEARLAARLIDDGERDDRVRLVITRAAAVLDRCDRVVHIDGGRTIAGGPHRRLVAECARYASLTGASS